MIGIFPDRQKNRYLQAERELIFTNTQTEISIYKQMDGNKCLQTDRNKHLQRDRQK